MNFSLKGIVLTLPLFIVFVLSSPIADYRNRRAHLLTKEDRRMLGGDISLNSSEKTVNDLLMKAKHWEIDNAFNNSATFPPSQNFVLTSNIIRQSAVFKIIQAMPKGAVLHIHDGAMVSIDYVLFNITYRPNLYVREDADGLVMKFYEKPPSPDYVLLSELRKNRSDIDSKIRQQLSMSPNSSAIFAENDADAKWLKFESIFAFIFPIIFYRSVFEDFFYQGLLETYSDNILYLELRSTLSGLYELDGTTYTELDMAKIIRNVTEKFMKNHPDFVGVNLIYSSNRRCNNSQFRKHLRTVRELKKELPDFFAGFDLVNHEDKGMPLVQFAESFLSLGKNVQLFFHAGETNWYGTSTDENLVDAVLLNTKRIGHGFALLKHPEVIDLVRSKKIAIEVSPISNQVLGYIKDLRNHPANYFFADNYPVVVSNDDPAFWGAQGLSYDFYEAFVGMMSRNADLRSLKKLALNSMEYSNMNEVQRAKAMDVWSRKWKNFVDELSMSSNAH